MTDNIFICKICQKEYKDNRQLSRHIHTVHKITYKDYFDEYLEPNIDHKCPYCES